MATFIILIFSTSPDFELSERAEKVEIEQLANAKITDYQIANIYSPKVRFSFCNIEMSPRLISYVQISKMKA